MKLEDWEIYRRIEMEIIKEEIDKEITKEKWKEIINNNFNIDLSLSNFSFIILFIGLLSCFIILIFIFIVDFTLLYKIIESPFMKPIVLVSIPCYFGIKSYRNDKKKQLKILKKMKKCLIKKNLIK